MCLYNTLIKNRKYTKTKKNGGKVPPISDERLRYIPIGCGNCIECRKEKAREWQLRMTEEIKEHTNGKFVTLTFSDESIAELVEHEITKLGDEKGNKVEIKVKIRDLPGYERDNQIATRGMRLFLERWRKEYKTSVRHWMITELGHNGTENIHLHGIIWTNEHIDKIREHWKYGYVWPRKESGIKTYVSNRTVNYIIKYITKRDAKHKEYKPKILTSAGIGNKYTERAQAKRNEYNNRETIETYKTSTGHEVRLPIYWRNKIYSEEEKEQLWLNSLDKNIRWVRGEKFDMSKEGEMDKYNKAVQWHRQMNHELGYGGKKNDNRKMYEEQNRELMTMNRINRALAKRKRSASHE